MKGKRFNLQTFSNASLCAMSSLPSLSEEKRGSESEMRIHYGHG